MEFDEDFKKTVLAYASKAGRYDALTDIIRGLSGSTIANTCTGNEMIDFLLSIVDREGEQ